MLLLVLLPTKELYQLQHRRMREPARWVIACSSTHKLKQ